MASAPPPFRPLPLLTNPHLQTVAGHLLPRRRVALPSRRFFVPFPDGDRAAVHESCPVQWQPRNLAVMLVHGMGGSHRSGYLERFAAKLFAHNVRVFRVDLRGNGDSLPYCKRLGHGGCSDDLRTVTEAIARMLPATPLAVVGFSLGGNVLLHMLGSYAAQLPPLLRAAAVNPPIDMERCCHLLQQPRNRLYDRYFIRDLWQQANLRARHQPTLPPPARAKLGTLRDFDDLYTAPLSGFRDSTEYYAFASSRARIPAIRIPTLILTARDDPFIAPEPFEDLPKLEAVAVEITAGGGHLGYLGPDGQGGIRWADQRLLNYLLT